jgi:hypothetical protein
VKNLQTSGWLEAPAVNTWSAILHIFNNCTFVIPANLSYYSSSVNSRPVEPWLSSLYKQDLLYLAAGPALLSKSGYPHLPVSLVLLYRFYHFLPAFPVLFIHVQFHLSLLAILLSNSRISNVALLVP